MTKPRAESTKNSARFTKVPETRAKESEEAKQDMMAMTRASTAGVTHQVTNRSHPADRIDLNPRRTSPASANICSLI